jgi:Protein of unknown function (DUF1592)/Protein of unknown function (DUF1588)/Protein of unknown function (DUF1595)/Protein of unknown function (DUF1585)/Protein of unknown function (DUF1587)
LSKNESKTFEGSLSFAGGLALLIASACTGKLADSAADPGAGASSAAGGAGSAGTSGGGSTSTGAVGAVETLDCTQHVVDPGPSPLRLLSREQYLNTVKALAGDVLGVEQALGATESASAFGLVQPDVTQVELEHYQKAASTIAAALVAEQARLDAVAPCANGVEPTECAKNVVTQFGALAYRAPVTDAADIERHVQLFKAGAATSYAHGIELLLQGMLQSPRFLYRVEVGTVDQVSEKAVKLSPFELAARLSYAVWDAPPNEQLARAAAGGGLDDAQGVAAQLDWMLEEPRGQKVVHRFLESWLHVGQIDKIVKSSDSYPQFQSPSFKESLKGQARAFFDDLLRKQGGKLQALFTSPTVFYNADLGDYYGVTGTDTFQSLSKTDGTAAGILTLPVILAVQGKPDESSPIHRGRFVREALLCQQLPAPPANIPPAPSVTPGVSTRERSAEHEVNPTCAGCHALLDQVGFGFENYDTLGRYRTEDGGKPIDASGKLVATRDADGPFNGVQELADKLAASAEVKECVTRQWFRFAINRFEQPVDGCTMKSLLSTFDSAEQDLSSLPHAIAQTDAFLYRRPLDFEVKP